MNWMLTSAAESMKAMLVRLGDTVPTLLGALVIFLVGWLLARSLRWVLIRAMKVVPVDQFAQKLHIASFLQKGDVNWHLSDLIGEVAYWVVMLCVLVATLDTLGMTIAAQLFEKVLEYVPQVMAGVIVLVMGLFFSTVVGGVIQTAAANAGITQAKGLGQITRVAVIIFSSAVALEKFFSSMIIQTTFTIVVAALCFGTALAFGLGCKDLAGRTLEEFIEKVRGE